MGDAAIIPHFYFGTCLGDFFHISGDFGLMIIMVL